MATRENSYTPAGNIRAPSKLLCLQWVKEAWDSLFSEVVKRSFISCGISVNVDGSEDLEIHSLKENRVAASARADLQRATTSLLAPQLVADGDGDIDYDPFADLDNDEDNDELDNNEVVLEDDC